MDSDVTRFVITGRLPGLNDYVNACRANRQAGAELKRTTEESIQWEIKRQLKRQQFNRIELEFHWYEQDRRRDMDNIAFAKKFILDALRAVGVIVNDGWKQIKGFSDSFYVDSQHPRVEVLIREG